MRFPSKEVVERIRSEYPVGTRVELVRMDDPQAPPVGTKGTVLGVDDIGSIMVAWDNGCGLSVAFGEDLCRKVETTSDGAKGCKLHNILRLSLCSILSEMALLLSSFRANMCTPKGCGSPVATSAKQKHRPSRQARQHTKRKRRIHHERENSKADRRDEKPDHRGRGRDE